MAVIDAAYAAMADINMWLKLQSGDDIKLSDAPSIIPLRWPYFKNNWNFIKQDLQDRAYDYFDPDFLLSQVEEFSTFIDSQRNINGATNPLAGAEILHRFYAIFDSLNVNSVDMTNEEEQVLEALQAKISAFSKRDFVERKNIIRDYRDRLSDIYTLADDDYNRAYSKSSVPSQTPATIVNINEIATMHEFLDNIDFILANLFAVDNALDPFAIARANANNPEVTIGQYSGGSLVRLKFGESLQDLARKYLGDRDRWIDIALANGLKPPYIDEIGERLELLSNGNGNQINIASTDQSGKLNIEKFYINQPIFLKSNVELFPDQRSIVSLKQIPVSGEIVIELDGDLDLSKYKVAEGAHVRIYAPNTVNSQFYVLIPTTNPPSNPRAEEIPWFLAKSSDDEKNAKIDFALSTQGDINFSPNGDLTLSYGLDNAVQALKMKMSVQLGELRRHTEYGLINVIGQKNNDITGLRSVLTDSINKQISADPRFSRVESISIEYLVTKDAPTGATGMAISLVARLAGSDTIIPISFTINYN